MFQLAMTVVLTLALVLGGGATTAALAQTAAPDDVLYGVKLWTEDVRMGLESNPGAKLALALQFTDRRAAEVHGVLQAEGPIPESLRARFEHQLQEMLRLASGMGDGEIVGALERVRNQARDQERLMSQLQLATEPAVQSRVRVMSMLQAQAQIAQGGIEDPNGLRAQFRAGGQNQNLNQPAVPAGGANAGGAQASDSRNPWAAATPTPGSSYGPGIPQNPWSEGTPTPGSGYGPGSATGECPGCAVSLTPGVGYGPGPGAGECTDCPAAPGGGYGSGPGN